MLADPDSGLTTRAMPEGSRPALTPSRCHLCLRRSQYSVERLLLELVDASLTRRAAKSLADTTAGEECRRLHRPNLCARLQHPPVGSCFHPCGSTLPPLRPPPLWIHASTPPCGSMPPPQLLPPTLTWCLHLPARAAAPLLRRRHPERHPDRASTHGGRRGGHAAHTLCGDGLPAHEWCVGSSCRLRRGAASPARHDACMQMTGFQV